jgi:hypothetical protein
MTTNPLINKEANLYQVVERGKHFTADQEYNNLYKYKLEEAGSWKETKDGNGNIVNREYIPNTQYLVNPQTFELVFNDPINSLCLDVLEIIRDEDVKAFVARTNGVVGRVAKEIPTQENLLARLGISGIKEAADKKATNIATEDAL